MSRRSQRRARTLLCQLAIIALIIQPQHVIAAGPTTSQAKPTLAVSPSVAVADVQLQKGGLLQGQFVDSAGLGIAGKTVCLSGALRVCSTTTDEQGRFAIADLTGATYQLQVAEQTQLIRAWATGTAPPKAADGLMVVQTTDVVRGQRRLSPNTNQFFRVSKQRLANPLIFGGIVATAVAIPVAIHNADDDAPATP